MCNCTPYGKRYGQRDIVLLNAGFALFADGRARDIQEAFEMARDGIESGKATKHLQVIAEVSQKL